MPDGRAITPGAEDEPALPLSFNRAPAPDLDPWVGRFMVAQSAAGPGGRNAGLLCNDTSYLRTAIDAHWTVETVDGNVEIFDRSFLCGQNRESMRLHYTGPVRVAGIMLRPGVMHALWGIEDAGMVQRVCLMGDLGMDEDGLNALYRPGIASVEWVEALENWMRKAVTRLGAREPDLLSRQFEVAAFADPNRQMTDFAEEHGVTLRTLQRVVKRDFGMTPKQVMRRARVLDLASRLCGVADEDEDDILLRFFDQSHRIREFQAFFKMTPQVFRRNRHGLLTLSLEIRQARRLEMLDRIAPGAVRPWMRKPFVPAVSRTAS
ncbi:helix-turn-helix domain-containing protein [Qipengyuania zhejiangensis]|uniref:helix-turn-helix domain-containing protein n=1 Tax=Qipengyuania zhejiangensis TaxID=3077782 RepID=UPI002D789433|nr:helix-turn-helix domain-containing protein [Qipengyuania sp. Z2]